MVLFGFRRKIRRKRATVRCNQHESLRVAKAEANDLPSCASSNDMTDSLDETQRDDTTTASVSTVSPISSAVPDDIENTNHAVTATSAFAENIADTSTMAPVLNPEFDEVQNILHIMRIQESTVYKQPREELDELLAVWRKMLVEWMYFVVDYTRKNRQAVAAAAYFFDVMMAQDFVNTREEHQLAAATSLQLSLKAYDSTSIDIKKLVKLGRGLFTENDVVEMESRILNTLQWRLHPPTTCCFLRQYDRLIPSTVSSTARRMLADVTKLASELIVCEAQYNEFPASVLAYACMLMAMEFIEGVDLPIGQRHCLILNMATVAEIECSSSLVLKVFEELKRSLDESPKLQELIDSVAATRRMDSKVVRGVKSLARGRQPVRRNSPRNVSVALEPS